MITRRISTAPRWAVYGLLALAALAAWGWIKPYLYGPDISTVTVSRAVPVPVKVETVKYLEKVRRERVEVPVQVIREVPARQAEKLAERFDLKLPELHEQGRELVDVLDVPKAPYGGEMALTVDTGTGKIEGTFRATPQPFLQFGGMREAGLDYDAVNGLAVGYYRQDLLRAGPAILNGKIFAAAPLDFGIAVRQETRANFGASIGVAVRF